MLTDRKYIEDQPRRVFTLMYQQPSGCRETEGKKGRQRERDRGEERQTERERQREGGGGDEREVERTM